MTKLTIPARLHRAAAFDARAEDGEAGDTVELSFSSEAPVSRWFGWEVLGHGPGEVALEWASSGRMPLLADHRNAIGAVLGVIESARLDGGRCIAVARFGQHPEARDALAKVRSGMLGNISVGYSVEKLARTGEKREGEEVFRATRWTPREVSLVAAPADASVGVGRGDAAGPETVTLTIMEADMALKTDDKAAPANHAPPANPAPAPAAPEARAHSGDDVRKMLEAERAGERERCGEIERIGAAHGIPKAVRERAVADGTDVATFRGLVLDHLGDDATRRMNAGSAIGLTEREARRFSFTRALHAMANPRDPAAQEAARFEAEVSEATKAAGDAKRAWKGMAVPADVLEPGYVFGKRDQVVGTPTAGGNLVATDLLTGSFIDVLRAMTILGSLGARQLTGLVGNVAIPKKTAGGSAYWVGEGSPPTESQMTIGQVPMTPHTVAAMTNFSRRLLLQSSLSVEALIRADLAEAIALKIDATALSGDADADAPDGIADDAGINVVDFAAAGAPTFAEVVDCWTQTAIDNAAMGALAYAMAPAMAGYLKTTPRVAGDATMIMGDGPQLVGYRAEMSTQVPAGELWFGNWSDLIMGFWSGLDLMADPYSLAATGSVRVTAFQDTDNGLRRAVSFCKGAAIA